MSVFSHPDFAGHEAVHAFHDEASGLRAFIAVHNTNRGPASGGTRFWHYNSDADALTDALRLSRAMSYKNAVARLGIGGGKGVIMRPAGDFDREALFRAYGRAVEAVGGAYITAEDVGVSPADMVTIKTQTDHVAGLPDTSGDPSPVTADGVFRGVKVALRHAFGSDSLDGRRVAVQGLGHVGYALAEHLHRAGAQLVVADINEAVVERAKTELGARAVAVDAIHAQDVDVFAPCALGGAVSAKTLPSISARIIAGAANNQLATPAMAEHLSRAGKLYAPDYVINAGGIINVDAEVSHDRYDPEWVRGKLDELEETLDEVFSRARDQGTTTTAIAEEIGRARLAERRDWR